MTRGERLVQASDVRKAAGRSFFQVAYDPDLQVGRHLSPNLVQQRRRIAKVGDERLRGVGRTKGGWPVSRNQATAPRL
jgi:hypothetical protein